MNTQSYKGNINNCYYNFQGRCTHPNSETKRVGSSGRDFDSKINCIFTQNGAQGVCSWYFFDWRM